MQRSLKAMPNRSEPGMWGTAPQRGTTTTRTCKTARETLNIKDVSTCFYVRSRIAHPALPRRTSSSSSKKVPHSLVEECTNLRIKKRREESDLRRKRRWLATRRLQGFITRMLVHVQERFRCLYTGTWTSKRVVILWLLHPKSTVVHVSINTPRDETVTDLAVPWMVILDPLSAIDILREHNHDQRRAPHFCKCDPQTTLWKLKPTAHSVGCCVSCLLSRR